MPQSVYLLDASLRDNIVFGRESDGSTRTTCSTSCAAPADRAARGAARGLDAYLGDGGSRLSAVSASGSASPGRQCAPSCRLDEATWSLDNQTERRFTETIESIRGSVTTIVVAHRLSTVRHCDEVLFLEGGVVVSRGTFDEVAADNDSFAALVRLGRL